MDGKTIGDLYLPASTWNDEMFYYKLVEGVRNFGYPQGYFGFNESHGQYLSFAAWSPVLLLFWVIWSFLFGWNLLSPILCNLTILSLALGTFAVLVKPTKKQTAAILCFYVAFTPLTRFALSCIPEAQIFALVILFTGLCIYLERKLKAQSMERVNVAIVALFAACVLMTWMRPYLLLFFLMPVYYLAKARIQQGKKAAVFTILVAGVVVLFTLGTYLALNIYLSAPYLVDLYYTEWLHMGIRYTVGKFVNSLYTVWQLILLDLMVLNGAEPYSAAGLYYLTFLLLLCILFIYTLAGFVRGMRAHKDKKLLCRILTAVEGVLFPFQLLFAMVGFFVADMLMYRIQEGGRHTLVYILCVVLLLPILFRREKIRERKVATVVLAGLFGVFLFLYVGAGDIPYEYDLPYEREDWTLDMKLLEQRLATNMQLDAEHVPGYENTIIWLFSDEVEGEIKTVDFGAYYAVPKGFGVNLCDLGYVREQFDTLQSRYIGAIPGGEVEKMCIEAGGEKMGSCTRLVVYRMPGR